MNKAAITVDNWKLPIFRRLLTGAKFEFKEMGELTEGVTVLAVETDNLIGLQEVLEKAQAEARRSKLQ
jgi:hypothetical protein